MGSKGGSYDAGPMLEYGDKALKLQEQVYEDGLERTEPYYQGGTSALNTLLDYMGLQGGSVKSEDQWRNSMRDQFTTPVEATTGMYRTSDGRILTQDEAINDLYSGGYGKGGIIAGMSDDEINSRLTDSGYSVFQAGTPAGESVDYAGLDAAVAEKMAAQGETPEGYGSLLEPFSMDKFQADPGYQFRLDEGNKAIERAAAARGQYYDPSTVKALSEHNAGMADQTYNQAFDRYNVENNNTFNRLASIAGIGQNANAQTISAGQNYANQAGNIYGQMGNAVTSAQVAQASQPSMFDTLLNAGAQIGSAYLMSDARMKENIERIGEENGYPTYRFNYKHDPDKTYIGVMAQDIEKVKPEAIIEEDGIKYVNYDMLELTMKEVA